VLLQCGMSSARYWVRRVACLAASSASSLPGMPVWAFTFCTWMWCGLARMKSTIGSRAPCSCSAALLLVCAACCASDTALLHCHCQSMCLGPLVGHTIWLLFRLLLSCLWPLAPPGEIATPSVCSSPHDWNAAFDASSFSRVVELSVTSAREM
jgi:hypothetical protein